MAYPRKSKGYRRIIVDGAAFRWRFDTDGPETIVILQGGEHSGQQAWVTLTDVPNWWLSFPHSDRRPVIVQPRHVAHLIRLALSRGWTPAQQRNQINLPISWDAEFGNDPADEGTIEKLQAVADIAREITAGAKT